MGLSSKQVSSDQGLDWSQTFLQAQTLELPKPPVVRRQQQQNQKQSEPLKCPRCDSTNTKFCYYNNYNKSQPRHFCKTCKRHWTKGGTLRNVPVGGGRKNKRHKTSKGTATANATSTASTTITSTNNGNIIGRANPLMEIQAHHQQQNQNPFLAVGDQKNLSGILYQALISPPSSVLQQNSISCNILDGKSFSTSNNSGVLLGSSLSLTQNQALNFPYSKSRSFDTHLSSISTYFQSSNVHNYNGEAMEDSTTTTIPFTSGNITRPWQVPNTSSGMDMASYWNWDYIDTFSSTGLIIPWDDTEIKP